MDWYWWLLIVVVWGIGFWIVRELAKDTKFNSGDGWGLLMTWLFLSPLMTPLLIVAVVIKGVDAAGKGLFTTRSKS